MRDGSVASIGLAIISDHDILTCWQKCVRHSCAWGDWPCVRVHTILLLGTDHSVIG